MCDHNQAAATLYRRMLVVWISAAILVVALLSALIAPEVVRATIAPPHTADFTASGSTLIGQFGFDVAPAGDVNGDAIDDLLVGAPGAPGALNARKVFVYLGGVGGLSQSNVITLSSPTADVNDQFGNSVTGDGDIDGNGVSDILVGAYNGDISGTSDVGLVYVYTGSVAAAPTLAVSLTGEFANDNFGWTAAIIGHTDDDAYADIAVGAWQYGITDTGRVYIYAGRPDAQNLAPTLILDGEQPTDGYGVDVAGAGDIDGDGYADLLVGAFRNDDAGNDAGKVYVYFGSESGIAEDGHATLTGPPDSQFGAAVAGVGDVNGDGYADILVGADVADTGAITDTGKVYLYLGSPSGPVTPAALVLDGELQEDRFGFALAGGGDLNGDGFDDFGVGAKDFDISSVGENDGLEAGKAYAYGGCLGGLGSTAIFTATGELGGDNYARSLAIAGDLNADGVDDLVVGAFGARGTPFGPGVLVPTGKIYAYYGVDQGGCRASITLSKTVAPAQDPPVCGASSAITITQGESVSYCYAVHNSGTITLTHHFLVDSAEVDPIFERTPVLLTPGMSYTHLISYTPAISITHAATWTAIVTVTGPNGIPALDPDTTITATASAQTSVVVTVPDIPEVNPPLRLPAIYRVP